MLGIETPPKDPQGPWRYLGFLEMSFSAGAVLTRHMKGRQGLPCDHISAFYLPQQISRKCTLASTCESGFQNECVGRCELCRTPNLAGP